MIRAAPDDAVRVHFTGHAMETGSDRRMGLLKCTVHAPYAALFDDTANVHRADQEPEAVTDTP